MKLTRKCSGCGQDINKTEMLEYLTPSGASKWFCRKCYEEKLSRDKFADKVCQIFGLKSPGPVIWTQRKRLQEKFGFTDDDIIDTLTYVFNVLHKKILSESLYLVTPVNVMHMKEHKAREDRQAMYLTNTMLNQKYVVEKIIPKVQEPKVEELYSFDDWV